MTRTTFLRFGFSRQKKPRAVPVSPSWVDSLKAISFHPLCSTSPALAWVYSAGGAVIRAVGSITGVFCNVARVRATTALPLWEELSPFHFHFVCSCPTDAPQQWWLRRSL